MPGLPRPATRRLQAFSASWRFIPPAALPALFHAGNAPGVSPSEVVPLAGRRDLSVRLPLLALLVKGRRPRLACPPCRPWSRPVVATAASRTSRRESVPGCPAPPRASSRTQRRVHMLAPTCFRPRRESGPSASTAPGSGTSTRRALWPHSAWRLPQSRLRRTDRPGPSPPARRRKWLGQRSNPGVVGRRTRPSDPAPMTRGSERTVRAATRPSRRPVSAHGHRTLRSNRLASARSGCQP